MISASAIQICQSLLAGVTGLPSLSSLEFALYGFNFQTSDSEAGGQLEAHLLSLETRRCLLVLGDEACMHPTSQLVVLSLRCFQGFWNSAASVGLSFARAFCPAQVACAEYVSELPVLWAGLSLSKLGPSETLDPSDYWTWTVMQICPSLPTRRQNYSLTDS